MTKRILIHKLIGIASFTKAFAEWRRACKLLALRRSECSLLDGMKSGNHTFTLPVLSDGAPAICAKKGGP
jgi:hypothetical protein